MTTRRQRCLRRHVLTTPPSFSCHPIWVEAHPSPRLQRQASPDDMWWDDVPLLDNFRNAWHISSSALYIVSSPTVRSTVTSVTLPFFCSLRRNKSGASRSCPGSFQAFGSQAGGRSTNWIPLAANADPMRPWRGVGSNISKPDQARKGGCGPGLELLVLVAGKVIEKRGPRSCPLAWPIVQWRAY